MNVTPPVFQSSFPYYSSSESDIRHTMYAVRKGSSIYHLMERKGGERTVCGLKVRSLKVKLTTGLTNTPTKPLDKIVCRLCVRYSKPTREVSATP